MHNTIHQMQSSVDFTKLCCAAKQFLEEGSFDRKLNYRELQTMDSKYRQKIGDFVILCLLFGEKNSYPYSTHSINKDNKVIVNMFSLDVVNVSIDDEFIEKLTTLSGATEEQKRDAEAFMAMRKAIREELNYDKFMIYMYNITYMWSLLNYLSFCKGEYKNVIKEPSLAGESWTTQAVGEYVAKLTLQNTHLIKHIESNENDVHLCFEYGFAWAYQPELSREQIIHLFRKVVARNIDDEDPGLAMPKMNDAEYVFYKKHILNELYNTSASPLGPSEE